MKLLPWLKQQIIEHLDWVNVVRVNDGKTSRDQFLTLWLTWLIQHGFVKIFGTAEEPIGYLIARPVKVEWVFNTELDYFDTLFLFDANGEVAWIDSLHAKGCYADVLKFLRSTKKPFVAWDHNHKLYFKEISKLSGSVPGKFEIHEAFVRNL